MGYNVLSGSVSTLAVSQSGSFIGDGSQLEGVKQFELYSAGDSRLPFFKLVSGKLELEADNTLTFNAASNVLTVPAVTSSVGIKLSSPISGALGGLGSFLGLDADGNMIVTSSAAGGGPVNSLQFHTGGGNISGSSTLSFVSTTETLKLSGSFDITGSILPSGSAIYNLGSATQRWNQIFLGSGSLHLGSTCTISSDDDIGNITFNKPINIAGGISANRLQITSSVTASNLNYFIGVSASSPITIQMPGAQTLSSGQNFVIKDEAGNAQNHNITVKPSGSQTIDGETAIILESPFASINIYTNGSDKYFIY